MNKAILELNEAQIEGLIENLPIKYKIKLVYKLEQETLHQRWDDLLKNIDKRLKKFPISKTVAREEIEKYRREKYAQGCNRH